MAGSGFRVNTIELDTGSAVEVAQTDPAQLEVTINQDTPTQAQVEPVQTDPAELVGTVDNIIAPDLSDTCVTISASSVTARSSQLTTGQDYIITTDVEIFFRQGDNSVTATTSDFRLTPGGYLRFRALASKDYIAVITKSASLSGTVHIKPEL